jgi:hypothetical protein
MEKSWKNFEDVIIFIVSAVLGFELRAGLYHLSHIPSSKDFILRWIENPE